MIRDAFLGKVDKELKTSSKNTRPEIVEQIQNTYLIDSD